MVEFISREESISRLTSGMCPFCQAGPFKVPALHVQSVHGMDTRTLRDHLGLTMHDSICDPAHSAAAREFSRTVRYPAAQAAMLSGGKTKHRRSTLALRQANRKGWETRRKQG